MNNQNWRLHVRCALALVLFMSLFLSPMNHPVKADGYSGFEEGTDSAVIRDTIPGLHFTNTNGYDWVYGDWRTSNYNGKYPNGQYTSNGNFFAWLGSSQGSGRIDFLKKDATYLSLWVSAYVPVTVKGYNSLNIEIASATLSTGNTGTGRLDNLKVSTILGMKMAYVIISGTANYWLIDDITTDAGGVPTLPPVVLVPGVAGSYLWNGTKEVWPNFGDLWKPGEDAFLRDLKFKVDGSTPLDSTKNITVGEILRKVSVQDVYGPLIDYLDDRGYDVGENLILCPYDWRKDLNKITTGTSLNETLDKCITKAQGGNTNTKVIIVAHSMGGLISRLYIDDATRAKKVEKLITLGTPYFGAPKISQFILDNSGCFIDPGICLSNTETTQEIIQNFPSAYQLAPSADYFKVYPDGYIKLDYDKDGNGQKDGNLNLAQSFTMLSQHNSGLTTLAQNTYSKIANGYTGGQNNGVEIFTIIGDQLWTPATLVQYQTSEWDRFFGAPDYKYRVDGLEGKFSGGDGTVPLHSAEMRNLDPAVNVDLAGPATRFYFKASHGDLPNKDEIKQLVYNIIVSSTASEVLSRYKLPASAAPALPATRLDPSQALLKNPAKVPQRTALEDPRTSPLPLNGRLIAVEGDANLRIVDAQGNIIGFDPNQQQYLDQIDGATFYTAGETTYIYLPESTTYTVSVLGDDNSEVDVSIKNIDDDQITQTALYDDLPVTGSSTATLAYDPAVNPGVFQLDQNGDGTPETTSDSPILLDQTNSLDLTPPTTTITLSGTQLGNGVYTGDVLVTISSVDNPGGTGVSKILFSVDGGKTLSFYTGPFTIHADQVFAVLAQSTDYAGNEESPIAKANVGGSRFYLPSVSK
jgi:hypothetical protein